ncbi:hypothetical protein FHU10_4443 [Serratia fonticola]|jgi:hypothetical protein|uniref:Uncharacterized protein n=1 Tax=Serratia fonticola TaxID=47917 RepID=A0A542BQ33_SERFO|nr:hypothetical protein FHU09_3260 [Serratia fonticola]TQI97295.1 hypothetical protein FHU11_2784 [Serratia fonticola]TVZ71791.1 hypothetical protein FHU10_4443 [Serratia fonticola]
MCGDGVVKQAYESALLLNHLRQIKTISLFISRWQFILDINVETVVFFLITWCYAINTYLS